MAGNTIWGKIVEGNEYLKDRPIITDTLYAMGQHNLTGAIPDILDWGAKKIERKLFDWRYKEFILDSIKNASKDRLPPTYAEYKASPAGRAASKAYDKIGKWDFLKKPSFYLGPLSKAATLSSKLIGPLQYMLPGKLHSGELTEEQIRGVHHPNASIWG
jgi:hypothetical protein